jgi:nitrate/TMAO reductase-like tetraheme cytochrome c subunit
MTSRFKIVLFFVLIVFPAILAGATATTSFHNAQTKEFCSSCHVMTPWYADMTDPKSESLASLHFRRRWIQQEQCYTCHADYVFMGTMKAKMKGMRHVIAYYVGDRDNIKLYEPFPNENCMHCHGEAAAFRESPSHDAMMEEIESGEESCIGCHDLIHDVPGHRPADREAAAEDAEEADDGAEGADEAAAEEDRAKADDDGSAGEGTNDEGGADNGEGAASDDSAAE